MSKLVITALIVAASLLSGCATVRGWFERPAQRSTGAVATTSDASPTGAVDISD